MVNSKTNDDSENSSTGQEAEKERWERMYQHMGPSTPTPYEGDDDEDTDESTADDEVDDDGESETDDSPTCAECGYGPGAYQDEHLDAFTLNYDEEEVHYGCR